MVVQMAAVMRLFLQAPNVIGSLGTQAQAFPSPVKAGMNMVTARGVVVVPGRIIFRHITEPQYGLT
jgi:hypothetical protein